jgi:hypothetical protein
MNKRMKILLALLALVGALIAIDASRDPVPAVVEAPARLARDAARPGVAQADIASGPASAPASIEAPIRDLFGSGAAPAPEVAEVEAAPAVEPPPALQLLGFREEDGVREAYLLHEGAVLLARAGSELTGRYQVMTLGQDEVRILDRSNGREHQITFGVSQ